MLTYVRCYNYLYISVQAEPFNVMYSKWSQLQLQMQISLLQLWCKLASWYWLLGGFEGVENHCICEFLLFSTSGMTQ